MPVKVRAGEGTSSQRMTDQARLVETELKLRLAPKDASRLLESAALHAHAAAAPAATERLKTIYPAAILHDCTEGQDQNPVRLGSTNLGIF